MTGKDEKDIFLKCMDLRELDIPYPDLSNVKELLRLEELKCKMGVQDDSVIGVVQAIDYDRDMKEINELIYSGNMASVRFTDPAHTVEYKRKYRDRMIALFGRDYYSHIFHDYGDAQVCELLIRDAIKTGKWFELPDCLQNAYHNRVGDSI